MPQTCTICSHPEADAIDREIVYQRGNRRIATQYGLSEAAVRRHGRDHLPELLRRGREAEKMSEADALLTDVRHFQARTLYALQEAEQARDWTTMLRAVREARENVSLLLKVKGELDERPVINLVTSQEWIILRAKILSSLEPYPDARDALVSALDGAG